MFEVVVGVGEGLGCNGFVRGMGYEAAMGFGWVWARL